jgi:hypothetical protein
MAATDCLLVNDALAHCCYYTTVAIALGNNVSELIQEMGPDDISRQQLESRRIVIVAPQEGQVLH